MCLIHDTSYVSSQPEDAWEVHTYIKEKIILSYYARKISL